MFGQQHSNPPPFARAQSSFIVNDFFNTPAQTPQANQQPNPFLSHSTSQTFPVGLNQSQSQPGHPALTTSQLSQSGPGSQQGFSGSAYHHQYGTAPAAPSHSQLPHDEWGALTESKRKYQSGYMFSSLSSKDASAPQDNDPPLLPNRSFSRSQVEGHSPESRASHSIFGGGDFGMDGLFRGSHRNAHLNEEDAPPTASVTDIPTTIPTSSRPPTSFSSPTKQPSTPQPFATPGPSSKIQFLLIYGPSSKVLLANIAKISSTFGLDDMDIIQPFSDEVSEPCNWVKVGFRRDWEARKVLEQDGVVLDIEGSKYIIGVRKADGASLSASTSKGELMGISNALVPLNGQGQGSSTPIKMNHTPLTPSFNAFRKPDAASSARPAKSQASSGVPMNENGGGGGQSNWVKVGEMIFGW